MEEGKSRYPLEGLLYRIGDHCDELVKEAVMTVARRKPDGFTRVEAENDTEDVMCHIVAIREWFDDVWKKGFQNKHSADANQEDGKRS